MTIKKTTTPKMKVPEPALIEKYLHHVWVDFDDMKSIHALNNVKSKPSKKNKLP